jgi:hypothetical protein
VEDSDHGLPDLKTLPGPSSIQLTARSGWVQLAAIPFVIGAAFESLLGSYEWLYIALLMVVLTGLIGTAVALRLAGIRKEKNEIESGYTPNRKVADDHPGLYTVDYRTLEIVSPPRPTTSAPTPAGELAAPSSGVGEKALKPRHLGVVGVLLLVGLTLRLVSVVVGITHSGTTSPAGEGYRNYVTVDGTSFWMKSGSAGDFELITTGQLGGLCSYSGPYLGPKLDKVFGPVGYVTICDAKSLEGQRLIVYLVSDGFGPASAVLSDGVTAPRTATIAGGSGTPLPAAQRLDIVTVPHDTGSIVGTSFG